MQFRRIRSFSRQLLQSRNSFNNVLRQHHVTSVSRYRIQFQPTLVGPTSSHFHLDVASRSRSTARDADTLLRSKRKSRLISKRPRVHTSSVGESSTAQESKQISEAIVKRLPSKNSLLAEHGYALRDFEQTLLAAREDTTLLQKLQLSSVDARSMLLIPPNLLRDVHEAIRYYSKIDRFVEIDMPVHNKIDTSGDGYAKSRPDMNTMKKKVPASLLCVLLLEKIGLPQYYSHISTASSTQSAPVMTVHSSQVDKMIECSLLTAAALCNTCRVGRNSLIGYDFNSQHIYNVQAPTKTAAALAEEIWRSVSNMQILYTSGDRSRSEIPDESDLLRVPIRIGRVGFIGDQDYNPLMEYIRALREPNSEEGLDDDFSNEIDSINDVDPFDYGDIQSSAEDEIKFSCGPKDQRRYDQTLMIFNSVLDAYANLGSSASGSRPEVRREMVMNCERLLLEVIARENERVQPSPETILQCVQPDSISFNTVMKAWAEMSSKQRVSGKDDYANRISRAAAERTEGILEMMYEYCEKERAHKNTFEAIHASWKENGVNSNTLSTLVSTPNQISVVPNTVSYNIAMRAWSRSSDPHAAIKAMELFERMVQRCNATPMAREAMVIDNVGIMNESASAFHALPDSRTFTALLSALGQTSSTFQDVCELALSVFVVMKEWQELLLWCSEKGIGPPHLSLDSKRILNEYTYNALIRTLSKVPAKASWKEHYRCCKQIDKIIEEMKQQSVKPNAATQRFGINAWVACAMQAEGDKSRIEQCAKYASLHLNELLLVRPIKSEKAVAINALNDVINLYGRASQPMKAVEVFNIAKDTQLYNLQSLTAVIDALAKNSDIHISYADKAKQYLLEFEQEKMRMSPSMVFPDMKYTKMYNSVISGYLKNKSREGLTRAQELLSHMIKSHESNQRHIARPNTTSFVPIMSSLAYSDSPETLEKLFTKMEALYQRRKRVHPYSTDIKLVANVEPNTVACNTLLKAYARVGNRQAALKLLGRMEKDENLSSARPDNNTHAIMSKLFSGDLQTKKMPSSGRKNTPEVLNIHGINLKDLNLNGQDMKPTAKSFESMMKIYTTAGTVESAEKATELLHQLESLNSSGEISFKPGRFLRIYNDVIDSWLRCEKSGTSSVSAAEKAEEILKYLLEQHQKGARSLSPNNLSFNLCIKAFCCSKLSDAPERAENVFRQKEMFVKELRDVNITAPDYNQVIVKWKDDQVNGPGRAYELFCEMDEKYGNSEELKARPNAVTLNSLLDVLAKAKSRDFAEKCEELLNETNERFKAGKSSILPDVISYRTCIDAWIRQWDKESPKRVEAIANKMTKKYSMEGRTDLRPDADLFNLVLKACAHATVTWHEDTEKEASDTPISIANRTFALLNGKNDFNAKPTHATYAFMFITYKFHLDFDNSRYTPLLLMLWKQCCKDGQVSQFVLDSFCECILGYEFWKAIGGKEEYALLGKTDPKEVKVSDLPEEWSRNVKPSRKQKNRSNN